MDLTTLFSRTDAVRLLGRSPRGQSIYSSNRTLQKYAYSDLKYTWQRNVTMLSRNVRNQFVASHATCHTVHSCGMISL
eukprot:1351830-Amorphochlora_amoeboformis.AAC.1